MDEPSPLLTKRHGSLATFTLNRPERRNALNPQLDEALWEEFTRVAGDETIRAVILRANGSAFCSGADLKTFDKAPKPDEIHNYLISHYLPLIEAITECPKPVIAAINGAAAGAGCALALACDLRVMAREAEMIINFSEIGFVPDMGLSWFLVHQIGYARAFELSALAESISAEQCEAWGLVNKVTDRDQLDTEVRALIQRLLERPTRTLGLTKRALRHAMHSPLSDAADFEAKMQRKAASTDDYREGFQAFRDKRPPSFTGK